jgi:hypothetical protein
MRDHPTELGAAEEDAYTTSPKDDVEESQNDNRSHTITGKTSNQMD